LLISGPNGFKQLLPDKNPILSDLIVFAIKVDGILDQEIQIKDKTGQTSVVIVPHPFFNRGNANAAFDDLPVSRYEFKVHVILV
jgi:hypothetical protein